APKVEYRPRKLYVCTGCGGEYDPLRGDPAGEVKPGTAFRDLPDGWMCPHCGEGVGAFIEIEV
ncbi:MAG: rubredoxin, partial [Oscillibacter sp.]|nr:rubredoxin [Oscillibacter sp.]